MNIIVCGGRDFRDKEAVFSTLSELDRRYTILKLVHGGASGADTLAGMWGKEWGVEVFVLPADWAVHGKAAGPIRNQHMLEQHPPHMLVAFPGGKGTADMVARARRAGIPVHEYIRPKTEAPAR